MQSRLVLIRHGQVDAAWHGRIYGSHDVPLSPLGVQQATEAATHLAGERFAAVISSPLSRTRHGAQVILKGRKLEYHSDQELREIERGEWVGRSLEELGDPKGLTHTQWLANPKHERPPGGENLSDLAKRVLPRLDHWSGAYEGQSIAIVSHSWVIRIAICEALKLDLNQAVDIQVETGAITVLDWSSRKASGGQDRDICFVGLGLSSLPDQRPWFRRPNQ